MQTITRIIPGPALWTFLCFHILKSHLYPTTTGQPRMVSWIGQDRFSSGPTFITSDMERFILLRSHIQRSKQLVALRTSRELEPFYHPSLRPQPNSVFRGDRRLTCEKYKPPK